ncbi:MAG: hypothetical protein RLZZ574_3559, partial [Cyanobacteriota bacterium]
LAMGCFVAIAQKILVTIKQITEKLQFQKEASQDIQKAIAPPVCSIKKEEADKNSETQVLQKLEQSDRTLMKCCVGAAPYLVYRVFVLKLELTKLKIMQQLENLFVPETKTSEAKFLEIHQARRKKNNNYFYHGVQLSFYSVSNRRRRDKPIKQLKPGTKVKISTDFHSSSLGDDNRQVLVYVRSKEVKTREKYSVPLNTLIPITVDADSYVKAVLPQIKGLVAALGLTKEDYLKYIKQTYGAQRTGNLRSTEIFAVVTYFQKMFYSLFDSWSKVLN